MPAATERIHLTAADTVVAIRERLSHLRGQRVLLIWTPEATPLLRKLDLLLIQREADRRALQLALVSPDKRLMSLASELNMSCFPSIDASVAERWKRGRQKRFLPRYHKPSANLAAEDIARIAAQLEERKRQSPWRAAIERFIALILLAGVIAAAFYVLLPSAAVEVRLAQANVSAVVDIIADSKAQTAALERGVIPAQSLRQTVETSATIPASGEFWLDSVSAAAVATFTNLGDARVVIPAKTILGTSAGEPILFETVADVVVPAGFGRSVDASVQAREGYRGSIGNVGAGMINTVIGALAESVSVINLAPAAGGGVRSVKVVAADDMSRLLDSLRIQLQSLAFERMRAALSASQVIIIESIGIEEERKEWTRFSADVGTMTSELSLTMRAVVGAVAVDDRYSRQVILARLKANLKPNQTLLADSIEFSRGPFSLGRLDGQVRFTASGSASAVAELDVDALRAELAGISLEEALSRLNARPELSASYRPRIKVFPPGLERLPILALRIDLRLKEPA